MDQKYIIIIIIVIIIIIIIIIIVIIIFIFIIVIIVRSKPLKTACHHQIHADILLHFPDIMIHATLLSKKTFQAPSDLEHLRLLSYNMYCTIVLNSNYLVGGRLENEDNLVESWTESIH